METLDQNICEDFSKKIHGKVFSCPVRLTMDVIGGKWKILLLWQLVSYGTTRYSQFKKYLGNITDKMLTQSLREMEWDGLIVRRTYGTVPPQVEYSLSERGKELEPMIRSMHSFGMHYRTE